MRFVAFLAAFALSLAAVNGDDEKPPAAPNSPAVTKAIKKADAAAQAAKVEFDRAMAEIKRVELAELRTAQTSALADNKLDEATAIAELTKAVRQEYESYGGKAIWAVIAANKEWQSVGALDKGTYEISALGSWSVGPTWPLCGPDGYLKAVPGQPGWRPRLGALLARANAVEVTVGGGVS